MKIENEWICTSNVNQGKSVFSGVINILSIIPPIGVSGSCRRAKPKKKKCTDHGIWRALSRYNHRQLQYQPNPRDSNAKGEAELTVVHHALPQHRHNLLCTPPPSTRRLPPSFRPRRLPRSKGWGQRCKIWWRLRGPTTLDGNHLPSPNKRMVLPRP